MKELRQFFKERVQNPEFYIRVILISFLPILSYFGMSQTDLTSWASIGDLVVRFFSNPYLIGLWLFTLVQSFRNTGAK
ncbi:MAG: phage holin [Firmicutes bacterium]|nr:phage holin [Bacillota bacterium]